MTDPRPARARAIFDRLLDLPREETASFLRDACRGDPGLEEEVRSLLEAHEAAGGFLEGDSVARALATLSEEQAPPDPLIGATVGDYRIVALLGRGGMGAVYRAEQEHPRRAVALKVLDRGLASPEHHRRFEVEVEVLARLKHPGIAQIHVAGTTGPELGGRPWFAMELVQGLPLTDFADEERLDLRARVELLVRVCEAVQHAHQLGVIHRDLKPANILVADEGQPKVLDFGIARSTDSDLQITTMGSSHSLLVGTLPYMSPEQVGGRPQELDTRSDVHALGVLGYELLTGHLPRSLEGKSLTEAIRIVADEEPLRLSATGRRFPTDLEVVIAKALERDRTRRYDSASALAADLRRFLDGQPIAARAPSALYQVRKLVARNRLATALVAGLVVVAVASAIFLGVQTRRTALERDRASLEAVTASEVLAFLESLFLQADPELALGETLTARELLDRGADRIETELRDQPAVRGRLLGLLGKVYVSLGERDRARPLAEEAVELGRALRTESGAASDRGNLTAALCLLGTERAKQGRVDEAIALSREAVSVAEVVHGPESIPYATCVNHLGYHLVLARRFDEAREQVLLGLELRERLLGPEDVDTGWSVYQYAHLLRSEGKLAEAREHYERATAIWEKTLPANHPRLAECLIDHSLVLTDLEEYDAALELAERALAVHEQTLGHFHPRVADALNDLGFLHWRRGDLEAAQRSFVEAAEVHRVTPGAADPALLERLYKVAYVADKRGRFEEEEGVLQDALGVARSHHLGSPIVVSTALGKLGFLCGKLSRDDEAAAYLREAIAIEEELEEPPLKDLLVLRQALATALYAGGDAEEAIAVNEWLLATVRERPELQRKNPLFTRWEIALAKVRLGGHAEAEADLRELLPEAEQAFGTVNAFFPWNIRWVLAHCRFALGFEEEARELYAAALAVDPEALGDDVCWLLLRRAEDAGAKGRVEEARALLRRALEADLGWRTGELALRLNPRLSREVREALREELGRR